MRTKVIKNTLIYTIGNLLPKITSIILLPVFSFYMVPSEYGILSATTAVINVLNILLILSIPRSIPRLFFDYEDPYENKVFFGTIFISVFVIATIQILLLFLFSNTVAGIYKNIPFYPYFMYALLTAYFSAFFYIANAYYRQKGQAGKFIIQNFINFIFITGGSLLTLIIYNNGAESVLLGKFYGSLCIFGLTIYLAKKIAVLKFDRKIFKSVMLFSLPLLPSNIFAWVLNLSDRIFIERYFELTLVGLYSMAYQIAQLTNLFGSSMKQAYDPWFFKQAKNVDDPKSKENIKTGNNAIIISILFIVFFISLFAQDGIRLFLQHKYLDSAIYVPVIALAVFIGQVAGLFNLTFYQEKKTMALMWINFASSAVNLMLNFLLIRQFGAMGAAWATVLSFFFLLTTSYFFSRKYFDMMIEWGTIATYLIIMTIIVIYFAYFPPDSSPALLLIIKILVFCIISVFFYIKSGDTLKAIILKRN